MFYPEELSPRRKLMFSMWDAPNDGKVRAVGSFDATNLNAYIASLNQQSAATGLARTSITHAAAKAIGTVALQDKYDFNGHFFAGRFFRHKDKAVGILVATDDGKDLGAVKIAQIDRRACWTSPQKSRSTRRPSAATATNHTMQRIESWR
ncbi:MAG: hypothetical protein ACO3JT_07435 [Candidatus Nanopelagicales bacterium]